MSDRMHPEWLSYLGLIGKKLEELDEALRAEYGDSWVYDFYPRRLEIATDGETVGYFRMEDDTWGWEEGSGND